MGLSTPPRPRGDLRHRKPCNKDEWWIKQAVLAQPNRYVASSLRSLGENEASFSGPVANPKSPILNMDLPASKRRRSDGMTVEPARSVAKSRAKPIRQRFLPRQMLYLLAQRIAREEFKAHNGAPLHDIWKDFIWDEKLFPDMVNQLRASAVEKLKRFEEEFKDADEKLYEDMVPDHLRSVLSSEQRRNAGMFKRMIEEMEWPDENLWRDIVGGFQSQGVYENGQGLSEDPKYKEALGSLEDWLNKEIKLPACPPTFGTTDELQLLADTIDDELIQTEKIVEIEPEELLVNPARAFPKIEHKANGRVKCRILIDERGVNSYRETRFKAKLNGSRHHTAILEAFVAPPGGEEVGWVPAHQSRRDLWKQCVDELGRLEKEDTTTDAKRILAEIRKTMKLVHQPKFMYGKYRKWIQESNLPVFSSKNISSNAGTGTLNDQLPLKGEAEHAQMATKDWSGAYFQVGVRGPELNPITWWDPKRGKWRYALAKILNMGSKFSVPPWCRVANFTEAAAAWYGHLVAPIYIDDAAIFGLSRTIKSGVLLYETLSRVLGLELSGKADANQESLVTNEVRLLGLIYSFDRTAGTITVSIPEDTRKRVHDTGDKILDGIADKKIVRKDIEKFVGGLTFVACASGTRAGMELIRPLHEWATEESFEILVTKRKRREGLKLVVKALLRLLEHPMPMVIGQRSIRQLNLLVTDASGCDQEGDVPELGAMLWTPEGNVYVTRMECPSECDTNIAVLEARAVAMGLATWRTLIEGSDVLVYLDNQNAAYSFVRAGGKAIKTARITTDTALWGYETSTRLFYQYIRTDLNPADALTRQSWKDLEEFLPPGSVWAPVLPDDGLLSSPEIRSRMTI